MRLRVGVSSDRGHVRQTNEDSYLVRKGLYAVCDGMGGARAGEVASEMACRGLLTLDPESATAEDLRQAIVEVDHAIVRRSLEEDGLIGMGTTLTAALARAGSLTVAHVGDSRAYRLRSGVLDQLTDDHSWVGEMVRRGELTPAQAAVHPHRSVITRVLGAGGELQPDIIEVPVEEGDRVLICSDGLTGMVSDEGIAGILRKDLDPQTVAEQLVQAALAGGGEDNVTVVVVDVLPSETAESPPPDRRGADKGEKPPSGGGSADDPTIEEDGTALDEDEILMGPDDRGIVSSQASGLGGRLSVGMRGRLGGRISPLRSPSIRRPVAGGGSAGAAAAGGLTKTMSAVSLSQAARGGEAVAGAEAAATRGRRRTGRRWLIIAMVVVIVLAILVGAFAVYNSTVYYVGAYDGTVALFRGLPASIIGIHLSSVVEVGKVARDSLAPHVQARIDAHDLVSKEEGQLFLRTLGTQ